MVGWGWGSEWGGGFRTLGPVWLLAVGHRQGFCNSCPWGLLSLYIQLGQSHSGHTCHQVKTFSLYMYMYDIHVVYSCTARFMVLASGILWDCFQTVIKVNCRTSNRKKLNTVNLLIINVNLQTFLHHLKGMFLETENQDPYKALSCVS